MFNRIVDSDNSKAFSGIATVVYAFRDGGGYEKTQTGAKSIHDLCDQIAMQAAGFAESMAMKEHTPKILKRVATVTIAYTWED